MNQVFGYQILPHDIGQPRFELDGADPIEIPFSPSGESSRVKVVAYPDSTLQASFSLAHKSWIYIWGIPAHPRLNNSGLPDWCAKNVREGKYGVFKELLGSFIIIVDDPNNNSLTIISDILGVRPMFLGKQNGRIIFGSKVWPIYGTGLISGAINYEAVSSWISYGFNCSNGSLFSDLRRLPAGSAVVIKDGEWEEISYATFQSDESSLPTPDQMAEELHEIVSSTLRVLLANTAEATLALSGGYDSRYLLALSLSLSKTALRCATVSISKEEEHIAHQVAKRLEIPVETIPVGSSEWDLYDDAFHLTADGFPISKFLTYCLAQQHSNIPMLNGYMGDSLIRGSKDTFLGKYEEEWSGDLVAILQRKHVAMNSMILRSNIAQKIEMRSRIPMEEAVQKGSKFGKVFGWADFYFRQRLYISNNFLQHLDLTEALLPFYSWELLSYKMRHDCQMFSSEVYEKIFARNFPILSNIPRSDTLPSKKKLRHMASCTKQWARQLLPAMYSKKCLGLLDKKWCLPRTLMGITGIRRYEGIIHHFQRLYLLEEKTRTAGLNFDWDQI